MRNYKNLMDFTAFFKIKEKCHNYTNTIEVFGGGLKRVTRVFYYWASYKQIQKYCNEFACRYNNRKFKNNDVDFLSGVANPKLTYKILIL